MANKFFITKGKYTVLKEWFYNNPLNDCFHSTITHATPNDKKETGRNSIDILVGKGYSLDVYDTLEEALYRCGFDIVAWDKVKLCGLTRNELGRIEQFKSMAKMFPQEVELEYIKMLAFKI